MQRSLILAAGLSLLALTAVPACNGNKDEKADDKQAKQASEQPVEPGLEPADEAGNKEAEPGQAGPDEAAGEAGAGEAGAAEAGAAEAGAAEAGAGEADADEAGADEPGTAEAGAAEAGAAEAGAEPAEDVAAGLFEQAKSLDTDDAAAKKALTDAIAAGGSKLDAAKAANARGEALMAAGEGERAAGFFQWAADTHSLLAEPVYNLATLAAYAGDLDIAKEHLQELKKRGNKKLMKKVGIDPAFALLHDDPEVREIYEQ